jgi:peroxiredoxin
VKTPKILFFAAILMALCVPVWAVRVGETAPDFTATDSNGQTHTLSAYRGKFVVLEWHNRECPYTHKQYASGNMEQLQKKWTARGVQWFTVISSAPGKQGYVTADEENAYVQQVHAAPTAVLLDPEGKLGRLYEAKTTPHMFVIDPNGKLIYDGAIDDKPTTDVSDIAGAHNYVDAALTAAMAGQAVQVAVTRPYGCSVKYAH